MHDLWRVGHHGRWLIAVWDRSEFSMASSEITLESVPSVSDIKAAQWDACANPRRDLNSLENLDTLASSGTAGDSCADSQPCYNPSDSHAFFATAAASASPCALT